MSTRTSRSLSPSLSISRISNPSAQTPTSSPKVKPKIFQFVKKTGSSIRNRVVKVKNIALGHSSKCTAPCNAKNCKCCKMVSNKETFTFNKHTVNAVGGCCKSYNIIYLFVCKLCKKHYVGRSTRPLRTRVGEHRRNFYKMCGKPDFTYDNESDEFALGHHIFHDHHLNDELILMLHTKLLY